MTSGIQSRVAGDVPVLELAAYQRTVRLLLRHPLVTATYPDGRALPAVRRWSATLRVDLAEMLGYRLEVHGDTARLVRLHDGLDPTQPALTRTGRPFDRQRYAYLALALAVLGRASIQITLSELADAVAADAARISGLGLDADRGADRRAFVDAVLWLEDRGALRLADGSAGAWASDPDAAEALYDVARDVVTAAYRPTRVLQHLRSVAALLERPPGTSDNARRRAAAQRARRAVVESPVVYYAEVEPEVRNHLRTSTLVEDIERLTGLRVERRSEGLVLVDTAGLTDRRFPGTGAVAQAALLLLGEIADRVVDPDAEPLPKLAAPSPPERLADLVATVDAGLPVAGLLEAIVGLNPDDADARHREPGSGERDAESAVYPFVPDAFLRAALVGLMRRYGKAFGEKWREDPDRLRTAAIELLAAHRLLMPMDGGVLVLPLTGRYRNVIATIRGRRGATPATLFDLTEESEH